MTEPEVVAILGILRSVWHEATVTPQTIQAWSWAFEDVPYPAVEVAAKRWIRTGKFFPRPAELRELVATEAVAPDLIPEGAWAEVLAEVRRVGFNRPPVFAGGGFLPPEQRRFSSPLIERAVAAVGWELICTGDDSRGFVRKAFVDALEAIRRSAVRSAQVGDIGGEPAAAALPAANIRRIGGGVA